MRLLLSHDEAVAQWIGSRIGVPVAPPYTAVGWIDDIGLLKAGFAFNGYTPNGNIDIAVALSGLLTRQMMAFVAKYAFQGMRVRRITARTRKDNRTACSILERTGFKMECVCKAYFEDDDAAQYRMLMTECKWL